MYYHIQGISKRQQFYVLRLGDTDFFFLLDDQLEPLTGKELQQAHAELFCRTCIEQSVIAPKITGDYIKLISHNINFMKKLKLSEHHFERNQRKSA